MHSASPSTHIGVSANGLRESVHALHESIGMLHARVNVLLEFMNALYESVNERTQSTNSHSRSWRTTPPRHGEVLLVVVTFVSCMPQLAIFLPYAFIEIRGQFQRQAGDANEFEDIREIAQPVWRADS